MHLHAFIFIFMNACIFMHSSHEDADECVRSKEMRSNEMNARIFMPSRKILPCGQKTCIHLSCLLTSPNTRRHHEIDVCKQS
mmetsp:Transcript_66180/g.107343  ORF Transcript_66180/g.107343 Transcript_66180/m.107343 type:complete len:82 (-) Transcript_66180:34-279(-)